MLWFILGLLALCLCIAAAPVIYIAYKVCAALGMCLGSLSRAKLVKRRHWWQRRSS
ncbi:hypothetical protein KJ885_01640 [Patescibacteria group bacterium]|nr:hypothetical protein [Patescibacteria group bacterium]